MVVVLDFDKLRISQMKVPSFLDFKWSIGVTNTTAAPLWHLIDVGEVDYGQTVVFNSKLNIVEKQKSHFPPHDTIIDTAFEVPSFEGVGYMLIRNASSNSMRVDRVNLKLKTHTVANVIPTLNATHISIIYMNRERYLITSNLKQLSFYHIEKQFQKIADIVTDYPVQGKFFYNANDDAIYGGLFRNELFWVVRFTLDLVKKTSNFDPYYVWKTQSNNVNLLGIVEEVDQIYYTVSYFENDQFKTALGCLPLIGAHFDLRKEVSINVELFTSTLISNPQQ